MTKCEICGEVHEGIGGYYDRKRCELKRADERLAAARERGASYDEIRELKAARDLAAYTGD